MMELLQEKNKGKIILCNCGNFYVATGKDAVTLHEKLKEYKGKRKTDITKANRNCYLCKHNTKYYKEDDMYIKAVAKLYESEKEKDDREK